MKGGVGKSTLTTILASILYYDWHYPVQILDCDSNQLSIIKSRERDVRVFKQQNNISKGYLAWYREHDSPAYTVERSSESAAIERIAQLKEGNSVDVVLVDFPGRCDSSELIRLCNAMDYIISPIEEDLQTLEAGLSFALEIQKVSKSLEGSSLKELFLVWNKINKNARRLEAEFRLERLVGEELKVFDSILYSSVRYSREMSTCSHRTGVFRSTLCSPYPALREGTGIMDFVLEVKNKILNSYEVKQ